MNTNDLMIRGIIPELNFKFAFVHIHQSLNEIAEIQNLSKECKILLGEVLTGALLLTSKEIKQYKEVISIQIESNGIIKKILSYASTNGEIKGIILPSDVQWDITKFSGFEEGILQVNKFKEETKKVYSSCVELKPKSFSENLESFILKSEQTNSFLKIVSDKSEKEEIYGYIFEPFPDTSYEKIDLMADFLYQINPEDFLKNIFHPKSQKKKFIKKWEIKILSTIPVSFKCDCSISKIENLIFTLGKEEIDRILLDEGKIEIVCEFCKKKYIYNEKDIKRLFNGG